MPEPEPLPIDALAQEILAALRALPDRTTDSVRALRRGYSKQIAKAAPEAVVALALRLLEDPDFLARFVAYELIAAHRGALRSLGAGDLEALGRGIASWEAVDTFGCYLAGPAWREDQVPDSLIAGWAQSPDRWWRRAALVSTVPLNMISRGGHGDPARTLAVCTLLVADRDDMVVKALSWALRELIRPAPDAVRAFLAAHGDAVAARVRREVGHKLTTGLKNPRRRTADDGPRTTDDGRRTTDDRR